MSAALDALLDEQQQQQPEWVLAPALPDLRDEETYLKVWLRRLHYPGRLALPPSGEQPLGSPALETQVTHECVRALLARLLDDGLPNVTLQTEGEMLTLVRKSEEVVLTWCVPEEDGQSTLLSLPAEQLRRWQSQPKPQFASDLSFELDRGRWHLRATPQGVELGDDETGLLVRTPQSAQQLAAMISLFGDPLVTMTSEHYPDDADEDACSDAGVIVRRDAQEAAQVQVDIYSGGASLCVGLGVDEQQDVLARAVRRARYR